MGKKYTISINTEMMRPPVVGFLPQRGPDKDFKLNIEANHAALSGHIFEHDLQVASDAGLLGSIDASRGNPQNGWYTGQFPFDLYDTVAAMLTVLGPASTRARVSISRAARVRWPGCATWRRKPASRNSAAAGRRRMRTCSTST